MAGAKVPVNVELAVRGRDGQIYSIHAPGVSALVLSVAGSYLALMAGALGDEVDRVAQALVASGTVRIDVAEAELARLRAG